AQDAERYCYTPRPGDEGAPSWPRSLRQGGVFDVHVGNPVRSTSPPSPNNRETRTGHPLDKNMNAKGWTSPQGYFAQGYKSNPVSCLWILTFIAPERHLSAPRATAAKLSR